MKTARRVNQDGELKWTKFREVGDSELSEASVHKPILGFRYPNLSDERFAPPKAKIYRRLLGFLSTWNDPFRKTVDLPPLC